MRPAKPDPSSFRAETRSGRVAWSAGAKPNAMPLMETAIA